MVSLVAECFRPSNAPVHLDNATTQEGVLFRTVMRLSRWTTWLYCCQTDAFCGSPVALDPWLLPWNNSRRSWLMTLMMSSWSVLNIVSKMDVYHHSWRPLRLRFCLVYFTGCHDGKSSTGLQVFVGKSQVSSWVPCASVLLLLVRRSRRCRELGVLSAGMGSIVHWSVRWVEGLQKWFFVVENGRLENEVAEGRCRWSDEDVCRHCRVSSVVFCFALPGFFNFKVFWCPP